MKGFGSGPRVLLRLQMSTYYSYCGGILLLDAESNLQGIRAGILANVTARWGAIGILDLIVCCGPGCGNRGVGALGHTIVLWLHDDIGPKCKGDLDAFWPFE